MSDSYLRQHPSTTQTAHIPVFKTLPGVDVEKRGGSELCRLVLSAQRSTSSGEKSRLLWTGSLSYAPLRCYTKTSTRVSTIVYICKIPLCMRGPCWEEHNCLIKSIADFAKASFYLDDLVGSLTVAPLSTAHGIAWASIGAVIDYPDPETAQVARKRYGCLEPWVEDPASYGRVALNRGYAPCETGVVKMLKELLTKRLALMGAEDGESYFGAEMNARLVYDSERYYRAMYYGDSASWNLRDTHMFATLARLLKVKPGVKAVVWEHNSHVGDARAMAMAQSRDELNLGQLCRRNFSNLSEVTIIGCGTHKGEVAAADEWDEPMQILRVNPRDDSYERLMHDTGIPSFLLDLQRERQMKEVVEALMKPRLERFIGVIYRPATERYSHYMKAVLPKQFDAFMWFDRTSAVKAIEVAEPKEALARGETYLFGL